MKPIVFVSLLICAALLGGCQPPDPVQVATAKLKPVVDAYVYAWNTGNLDTLDAICDRNVVRHDRMVDTYRGLDSLKKHIMIVRASYPDFNVTIDEIVYFGDHTAVRWTITGTNSGPGLFPPTGKSFKVGGLSISRFVNGKLAEEHAAYDRLDLMQQLGFQLAPPAK